MFYLFQSDRLESLAEMCARIHQASPLDSVLAQEEVVVQSQGMRRYLNVFFARKLGVAANLKFSLPAGLAWQLMRKLVRLCRRSVRFRLKLCAGVCWICSAAKRFRRPVFLFAASAEAFVLMAL